MDAKTEGYLVAAMALIPTGVGMVTAASDVTNKAIGLALVGFGMVAIYLRSKQKDNIGQV